MSVLSGGIFSKPRGKTGGIVFGAARTRTGKLVTARELVSPSNPNTAAQQITRNKFKSIQDLIKRFGPSIYQTDWNRSVGQLPGFQSMNSIYLNQCDASLDLSLVNEINLGTLHSPDSYTQDVPGAGQLKVIWSTELGANGTANDVAVVLVAAQDDTTRQLTGGVAVSQTVLRSVGEVTISGITEDASVWYYVYFRGAGTAAGLLSVATPKFIEITP